MDPCTVSVVGMTRVGDVVRNATKRALRVLFGNYHYWKVFYIELPQPDVPLPRGVTVGRISAEALANVPDDELRERALFGGPGSRGFGLYFEDELAAIQWYWWGDRYLEERGGRSWKLGPTEAKSVGLYTLPEYRGQGYASLLKRYTAHEMSKEGFTRIYSRIWHSHRVSIAVSRNAGWRKAGSYIEVVPVGKRLILRVPYL